MRAWVIALGLGLAALSGVSASGQETTTATTTVAAEAPRHIPAGTYRLDPRHASVLFRIQHEGLAWFTARFDTKDATLDLNPTDMTQTHLTASVDATSVNTGLTTNSGERTFDRSIGNTLGARTAPQITFTSTSVESTGPTTARVTGDLAMNGQTHPVTLDVTFEGGHGDLLRGGAFVLGFSAQGTIDRRQWGVNEWSSFAGHDVQLVISAELVHT